MRAYSFNACIQRFAVKHLRSDDAADFRREVENLKRLSSRPHRHIIELLFTVELLGQLTYPTEYLLVFPLATGNLRDSWASSHNGTEEDLSKWTLEQCLGISQALRIVHGIDPGVGQIDTAGSMEVGSQGSQGPPEAIYGIHSDIKPENILWFGSSAPQTSPNDILKLADFGISTFHHTESRSAAILGAHTKTYRPPESQLGTTKSRAFDIWSLGCVFLEFVSYIVLGPGAGDFSQERLTKAAEGHANDIPSDTFYIIDRVIIRGRQKRQASVNPVVTDVEWQASVNPAVKDVSTNLMFSPAMSNYIYWRRGGTKGLYAVY